MKPNFKLGKADSTRKKTEWRSITVKDPCLLTAVKNINKTLLKKRPTNEWAFFIAALPQFVTLLWFFQYPQM